MTTTVDKVHGSHDDHAHHDSGKQTVLGFWIYLMTDCILFATAFAGYAVLYRNTGTSTVTAHQIFELPYVLVETAALLLSSITYGFAMVCANKGNKVGVLNWLAVTFLFGAVFIGMEINEFYHLVMAGHGPQLSAFLSAFFALVGMHGLHVTAGLLWMAVMMLEVKKTGLTDRSMIRLNCLSLFWHFLDIVWICVFTVVYLKGAM